MLFDFMHFLSVLANTFKCISVVDHANYASSPAFSSIKSLSSIESQIAANALKCKQAPAPSLNGRLLLQKGE